MSRPKLIKKKEAITIYLKEEILDKLKEYISFGMNLNSKNKDGKTALNVATPF